MEVERDFNELPPDDLGSLAQELGLSSDDPKRLLSKIRGCVLAE